MECAGYRFFSDTKAGCFNLLGFRNEEEDGLYAFDFETGELTQILQVKEAADIIVTSR